MNLTIYTGKIRFSRFIFPIGIDSLEGPDYVTLLLIMSLSLLKLNLFLVLSSAESVL